MKNIGFIGIGHMGQPMVMNLLKAGFTVSVYDLNEQAVNQMMSVGAKAARSLAELASASDVIISMVQTSDQVGEIYSTSEGILAHAHKDVLLIECSSIDITATTKLHKMSEAKGFAMVDAPVSGGTKGAGEGTLTFMVGGSEENFKRAETILKYMGKKIIQAGDAGAGQAAKICNNLILGISMIAVSEGFNLAKKLGLDLKKFFEISSNASGQCWAMTSYCPAPNILPDVPSSHDYEPGFMAKMMLKDLRLAHNAAESTNVAIPLGSISAELYELMVNEGFGELDFSAIIKLIEGQL